MCRGDWKAHGEHTGGFYSCNKYDLSDGKKADDEATVLKVRADLFKHYFDRFFGHDLGKRAAQKKKEQIQNLCSAYRTSTGRDPRFLEEAVDALVEARHMLKYTYVYAYFMDELRQTQNKPLFDYQQANAEGITERLADMIFNVPTEKIDADKVKSMTSITQKVTFYNQKGIRNP
jgi:ariadne-1